MKPVGVYLLTNLYGIKIRDCDNNKPILFERFTTVFRAL